MAEVTTSFGELWAQVRANSNALDACPRHRFEGTTARIGQKFTCLNCGGVQTLSAIGAYLHGYRAAGGNPDDVWPGFFRPALSDRGDGRG